MIISPSRFPASSSENLISRNHSADSTVIAANSSQPMLSGAVSPIGTDAYSNSRVFHPGVSESKSNNEEVTEKFFGRSLTGRLKKIDPRLCNIDDFLRKPSVREAGNIKSSIEMVLDHEMSWVNNRRSVFNRSRILNDENDKKITIETVYKKATKSLSIETSYRDYGFKRCNASDCYLAHLSSSGLPCKERVVSRLPDEIIREMVSNDISAAYMNDILEDINISESRGGEEGIVRTGDGITIHVNHDEPAAITNLYVMAILSKTDNGKSTAHLIRDFNTLNDQEVVIESMTIDDKTITFTLAQKDEAIRSWFSCCN